MGPLGRGLAAAPAGASSRVGDAGFTLIEVMVAMAILLVGVLGTLGLLTGAFESTARTTAREQATNLARDLIERSRQVAYGATTRTAAAGALMQTLPGSDVESPPDAAGRSTVRRRNVTYTVRVSACAIDDPSNGVGRATADFCAARPDAKPGDPDDGTRPAVGLNVLGVAVATDGALLDVVCGVVGTNTSLLNTVGGLVGGVLSATGGAELQVCPGPAATAVPLQYGLPDDFHRVRVEVTWDDGAGSVAQTTLLPNPS